MDRRRRGRRRGQERTRTMKYGKRGRMENFGGGLEDETDKLVRKEVERGVTLSRGEQGRGFE